MIYIQNQNESLPNFDIAPLEIAANTALKEEGAENVDLSIVLTDDANVQTLNRDYRGYDKPTDVLSFEAHEKDPETGILYLGDIIISLERASAQAERGGHPLIAETQLLVVHGVLHLLGHDHAEPEEKAKMWQHQAQILACLGLSDLKIQEE